MPVSPPTKKTVIISLILIIIGIVVSVVAYLAVLPADLIPQIGSFDSNGSLFIIGFIIDALGWGLFFLGTRIKGM